jgi:hypothetical protein
MSESPDSERLEHDTLQRDLAAARERRDTYQALLKDLPEIFEGRFRERLRPLQQRNEQLRLEAAAMREQIQRSLPPAADGQASLGGDATSAASPGAAAPAGLSPAGQSGEARSSTPSVAAQGPGPTVRPDGAAGGDLRRRRQPEAAGLPAWLLAAAVPLTLTALVLAIGVMAERRAMNSSATQPDQANRAAAGRSGSATTGPSPAASGGEATERGRELTVQSGSVRLETREPSWLEVETSDGRSLYFGLLEGGRSFPLREGLRVRAGRPDLILIRWPGGSQRVLGSVEEIDWQTIPPLPTTAPDQ